VTDFLLSDIETSCEKYIEYDGYVLETTYHYYLEDYNVFNRVLEPYLHGEITFAGARKLLVRSSPYHFAEDYLDYIQAHHGWIDQLARVEHSMALYSLYGGYSENKEVLIYSGQDHSIEGDATNFIPPPPDTDEYADWIQLGFFNKVINGN
jgi:hypothetical protein